jgi:hypothetical protein
VSRPPNPYRAEFWRLESEGNIAHGRGDHDEGHRLWHEAAALKLKGQREVDAIMAARPPEPNPPCGRRGHVHRFKGDAMTGPHCDPQY